MSGLAPQFEPPYYAVIFSSTLSDDADGYADTARRMEALAAQNPGFLGVESAREGIGVTVSYWRDLDAIAAWKSQVEHLEAQRQGKSRWYEAYRLRVAKVERSSAKD